MLLFSFVFILFSVLLFKDPGSMHNDTEQTLLSIVENNLKVTDYCPKCIVKKKKHSKHCLICDKCVDNFDHHCYWINNCIGKNNNPIFNIFLISIILNLIYNLIIQVSIWSIDDEEAKSCNAFPGKLPINELYSKAVRNLVSIVIFIVAICFMFPVIILFIINVKNSIKYCLKKRVNKMGSSSILSINNSNISNTQKENKDEGLLIKN